MSSRCKRHRWITPAPQDDRLYCAACPRVMRWTGLPAQADPRPKSVLEAVRRNRPGDYQAFTAYFATQPAPTEPEALPGILVHCGAHGTESGCIEFHCRNCLRPITGGGWYCDADCERRLLARQRAENAAAGDPFEGLC